MTRSFESYIIVAGVIFPCDTHEQIKEAEVALLAAGVAEARIFIGLPPEGFESPLRVYAHNALCDERRAA